MRERRLTKKGMKTTSSLIGWKILALFFSFDALKKIIYACGKNLLPFYSQNPPQSPSFFPPRFIVNLFFPFPQNPGLPSNKKSSTCVQNSKISSLPPTPNPLPTFYLFLLTQIKFEVSISFLFPLQSKCLLSNIFFFFAFSYLRLLIVLFQPQNQANHSFPLSFTRIFSLNYFRILKRKKGVPFLLLIKGLIPLIHSPCPPL